MMKLKFEIVRQPLYHARMDIHIFADGEETGCLGDTTFRLPAVVQPVRMMTLGENEQGLVHRPAMSITRDDAQALMDALYDAGVRPTNGAGSVGQLAATERHLADLKTIAFNALKITAGAKG